MNILNIRKHLELSQRKMAEWVTAVTGRDPARPYTQGMVWQWEHGTRLIRGELHDKLTLVLAGMIAHTARRDKLSEAEVIQLIATLFAAPPYTPRAERINSASEPSDTHPQSHSEP